MTTYAERVLATRPASLIQYLMLDESSGTQATDASGNGRHGTYTNVTLGEDGIGDGRTAARFDGATSVLTNYSSSYAAAWNSQEHSISMWLSSDDAAGTTNRRAIYQAVNSSNRTYLQATGTVFSANYQAGGTNAPVARVLTAEMAAAGLFHVGITVSTAGDRVRLFVQGQNVGEASGLGTWAGALSAARTMIGAIDSVPTNPWKGRIAHVAVWSAELTASEMAGVGVVALPSPSHRFTAPARSLTISSRARPLLFRGHA